MIYKYYYWFSPIFTGFFYRFCCIPLKNSGIFLFQNLQTKLSQNVETLLRVNSSDLKVLMKRYDVTDDIVVDMVKSVKEWFKKQPHLPQDHIRE